MNQISLKDTSTHKTSTNKTANLFGKKNEDSSSEEEEKKSMDSFGGDGSSVSRGNPFGKDAKRVST